MKIARLRNQDRIFWATVNSVAGTVVEIRGSIAEWGPAFCHSKNGANALELVGGELALADVDLLAPIEESSKIVAIGVNYKSHLDELGWSVPPGPLAFLKPVTCIVDPDGDIRYPEMTSQLDYEIELVAIIGCHHIHDRAHGSDCILGYTIGNDVTARDIQFRQLGGSTSLDFFASKTLDSTAPVGPWITTCDEVGRVPDLNLSLSVNGEERQSGRTSEMIWGPNEMITYADRHTSLRVGDLLFTGTPSGVALSSGRYLQVGDLLELTIEGLGQLKNRVVVAPPTRAQN